MAIEQEIWTRDIAENLFPENHFIHQAIDDNDKLRAKTVHTQESGTVPNVEKNRSSWPAPITQQTDVPKNYDIDEYSSDPTHLQFTEEIVVSYQKRMDILRNHIEQVRNEASENIANIWLPSEAAQIARTSGAARAAYKAGQTGNRAAFAKADFIEVNRLMNRMNIPNDGRRIALIDADMEADLLAIEEFVSMEKIGSANLVNGAIGRLLGFNIMIRSSVGMYDNAGTPVKKAVGAAVAAADNVASLFWHPNFVRRAYGTTANGGIQVFTELGKAAYHGDLFSTLVRAGGIHQYTNQRGVVALVEAAA